PAYISSKETESLNVCWFRGGARVAGSFFLSQEEDERRLAWTSLPSVRPWQCLTWLSVIPGSSR
ncbi:hypothetical protein K0M31_015375, partial [Melipona bicolor]